VDDVAVLDDVVLALERAVVPRRIGQARHSSSPVVRKLTGQGGLV